MRIRSARALRGSPALLLVLSIAVAHVFGGCTRQAGKAVNTANAAPAAEVMHWLTAGRDAKALAILRGKYEAAGGVWRDAPMPGAGATGRAAVVNRIVGGSPPSIYQFSMGAQLTELAAQRLAAPVSPGSADWNAASMPLVQKLSRHEGREIAIPIAIRGENWMFFNAALLAKAGVTAPKTWREFLATARKLKSSGITALALGGQGWQERILFNSVLLGEGGREFYRRVYEQSDRAAISSPTMLEVFETFGALREFVDEGSPGRRWNQTTLMMIHGDAAFQFMGDWAKGEILEAGLRPGHEIGCTLAPGTDTAYVMMVDGFAFSPTLDAPTLAGQKLFANVLRDRDVQAAVARSLGAIPARMDTAVSGFDDCSALAMQIVRDPSTHLLDPGLSLPGGLSGAIDDGISQFWNHRELSAEQGRELLIRIFTPHE
jgi:glucose/mannose transport system substrate-binding protein